MLQLILFYVTEPGNNFWKFQKTRLDIKLRVYIFCWTDNKLYLTRQFVRLDSFI